MQGNKMAEEAEKIIIDGKNAALGRLAAFAAKKALQGKSVVICNCNEIIIKGKPQSILESYKVKRERGGDSLKGPNFPKPVTGIVRRTVRGMLPYKKVRGKSAFKRVFCYANMPENYADKEKINFKKTTAEFITLARLSELL